VDRPPESARQRVPESTLTAMSDLWVPDRVSLDDFVSRVHEQIARFAAANNLAQVRVEVELRDGGRYVLDTLSPDPGYGFVTLRPHPTSEGERQELIVPLASVAQIRIAPAEEEPQFGFAIPSDGGG
jgi:hypothetical protein